jgi:hypothetical protein
MVAHADTADAFLSPLGLILTKDALVTVPFEEASAFDSVAELIRRVRTRRF